MTLPSKLMERVLEAIEKATAGPTTGLRFFFFPYADAVIEPSQATWKERRYTVTYQAQGVPVRQALDQMLPPLGLVYAIEEGEVVVLTTTRRQSSISTAGVFPAASGRATTRHPGSVLAPLAGSAIRTSRSCLAQRSARHASDTVREYIYETDVQKSSRATPIGGQVGFNQSSSRSEIESK